MTIKCSLGHPSAPSPLMSIRTPENRIGNHQLPEASHAAVLGLHRWTEKVPVGSGAQLHPSLESVWTLPPPADT